MLNENNKTNKKNNKIYRLKFNEKKKCNTKRNKSNNNFRDYVSMADNWIRCIPLHNKDKRIDRHYFSQSDISF